MIILINKNMKWMKKIINLDLLQNEIYIYKYININIF